MLKLLRSSKRIYRVESLKDVDCFTKIELVEFVTQKHLVVISMIEYLWG